MSNIRELSQLASVIVVGNDTKNVGIGSTIPSSKLSVGGDAYVSGIVTAVEFYGDGSNLTGIATFSGDYEDLRNKPNIPLNTGDLTNNVGFITASSLVGYATETYVNVAIANLVDSSPSTLDTLNELASALGDDPNFATTITNSLANKADLIGATFTGIVTAPALNVGSAVTITSNGIDAVGIITAAGGFNLGISSAGSIITSGPIKTLNFIGAGNTFLIDGTTIDIGISGGGGGATVAISTVPPENPNEGDLWYSSLLGRTFIYYVDDSSSQWVDSAPFNINVERQLTAGKQSNNFIATEGQTTFTVSDGYQVGYIEVFLNGVRLPESDYTASNGSTVVLLEPASVDDNVDVVEFIVGIGATGPIGPGGPLSNVSNATDGSLYYPLIVSGVGSVSPYITTATNYLSFIPASGTLYSNQLIVSGVTTSQQFVKSGGTSNQFLKADGSVDSNTYLTSFTETDTLNSVTSRGNSTSNNISIGNISAINGSFSGIVTALDFDSASDFNLKENIQKITDPIEKVIQINGVSFDWKENGQSSAGVIAQEVEKIMPEIIKDNENGYKSINYNGLIGLLVEVVKNQQEQINILNDKITKIIGKE